MDTYNVVNNSVKIINRMRKKRVSPHRKLVGIEPLSTH